jgi:DNA polymerase III subunit epsilon
MYTIIDFETTGLSPANEQVIELGACKIDADFNIIGQYLTKVALRDGKELSDFIINYTGIKPEDLTFGLPEQYALDALNSFIGEDIIVAQFASFDLGFLDAHKTVTNDFICTKSMNNLLHPDRKSGLKDIVQQYGFEYKNHHQAMADVRMTAKIFKQLKSEADEIGLEYLNIMTETHRALAFVPNHAKVIQLGGK